MSTGGYHGSVEGPGGTGRCEEGPALLKRSRQFSLEGRGMPSREMRAELKKYEGRETPSRGMIFSDQALPR